MTHTQTAGMFPGDMPGRRLTPATHERIPPVSGPVLDGADCCGAEAFVTVSKPGRPDLAFCAHHYTAHEAALLGAGWSVTADRRGLVNAKQWG